MILSGLIFLPLLALPTLLILKKSFQIKFFYTFVSFINFGFSIGLLTKYGYFFEDPILTNQLALNTSLGIDYSVSATALDLLLCNLISLFYFLFGALNLRDDTKRNSILLMSSQSLALLAIFSDNLLLTAFSVFVLLMLMPFTRQGFLKESKSSYAILYCGFAMFAAVSLVFGILYESVYNTVSLNLVSLSKMKTPFVKGSFYSTQFNLALVFATGLVFYMLFCFSEWKKSLLGERAFNSFIITIVCFYTLAVMFKPLFPEVYSVYLPWAEGFKFYLLISLGLMTMVTVFMEFFGVFTKRGGNV